MPTDRPFIPLRVAVLTVSDTRTLADDASGSTIVRLLEHAGHVIAARQIVRDDVEKIRDAVGLHVVDDGIDVVITTGGTGFAPRDVTPEALTPLFTRPIPGFGELFRRLSYDEVGTSTLQSRAEAGFCGETLLFMLPGSPGAVTTAMEAIILEQLDVRHRPCNFAELLPRATSS
jgi:molybdenum cofactor biosynthesis protein B